MRLVWDFHKPIEIKDGWGKHAFDQNEGDYKEIEISQNHWKLRYINKLTLQTIDSGDFTGINAKIISLELRKKNGEYQLLINKNEVWNGRLTVNPGVIGIMLDPHSTLTMNRFEVSGRQIPGKFLYGCYEAILDAGNQDQDWEFIKDPLFRIGHGAVSKLDSAAAKWNFEGTGFELWLPQGPQFGTVSISVDSQPVGKANLKSDHPINSSAVFKSKPLHNGPHAVYVTSMDGRLPLDCLEVDF